MVKISIVCLAILCCLPLHMIISVSEKGIGIILVSYVNTDFAM